MKETIHMLILQHQILKAQKSLNHDKYCYHILFWHQQTHIVISIYFSYIILSIGNFHAVLSMFLFLYYWSHLKADAFHLSDSSLFRKKSIIGQLNVQAATAENQEKYIFLSNIMYIAFQNSCSFPRSFRW